MSLEDAFSLLNTESLLRLLQFLPIREVVRLKRTSRRLHLFIEEKSHFLRHKPAILFLKIHNDDNQDTESVSMLFERRDDSKPKITSPHIGVEIIRTDSRPAPDSEVFTVQTEVGDRLQVVKLPPQPPEDNPDNWRPRQGHFLVQGKSWTKWQTTKTRYRVLAPLNLKKDSVLNAVLELFTRHLAYNDLAIWGGKDAEWTEAAIESTSEIWSRHVERRIDSAFISYGTTTSPKENNILKFISKTSVDHLKICDHAPTVFSDAFFKNERVRRMSFFVFEGHTDIENDTFGALEGFRLALGEAKKVTVAGIRKWLEPVVKLQKEDKSVSLVLTWEEGDRMKLLEGLDARAGNKEHDYIISTADPKKVVRLSLDINDKEQHSFWARVEKSPTFL